MSIVRFEPRSSGPVCDAIRGRRRLALDYGDGERIVEPYYHGRSRAGDELVRAYQVTGPSRQARSDGWRLFRIDRITSIRVLDHSFAGEREGYHDRDGDIAAMHCQVPGTHRSEV